MHSTLERQISRNRFQHRLFRTFNGFMGSLPGRPRSAFRQRIPPPPRKLMQAEEWHFGTWRGSTYTPVTPSCHRYRPAVETRFPHPAANGPEWKAGVLDIPATFVLEIPFGRTVGRHGAVITPDDVLLRDLSRRFFCPPDDHPLLHVPELPKLIRRRGRYAVINAPGNSTYHWLYDTLPRFEVLRLAGYRLEDFDGFLMTRPKYKAHYETLERLGIPTEKIFWCTENRHVECDELVVPSYANIDRIVDCQQHPFVYPFLRSLCPEATPSSPRKRIYISRRDAVGKRRIVNEPEVEAALQPFGFTQVTLGSLTFAEQAAVFASAEVIVAPHGGGLSNLCFHSRPLTLVELFAPDYCPTHFRTMAFQLGLNYHYLFGESVESPDSLHHSHDIRLDITRLKILLHELLPNG